MTNRWKATIGSALGVGVVLFILLTAQHGRLGSATRNPAGTDEPLPVTPLLHGVDWVVLGQVLGAGIFVGTIAAVIVGWRRHPRHPFLLMVLASNSVCWFDPINNWAIGLVYNPRMWHFPQSWPWVRMSPIIEPLTSFIYAPYLMLPFFVAMPVLRRLQRKREPNAFVWRHPLISLGLLTFVMGFVWDAAQEMFLVSTQFLTYTHVTTFGSIWVGQNRQFPLLMASTMITIVMIPTAVLLYRDDTGRTQAEKLAQRVRLYRTRPATATFLVMAVILNVCFMTFSASFWLVRVTGAASSVACPWPYPEAKVWDPRGLYESQGQPGPYTSGAASTWLSAQPDGRPTHVTVASHRCQATNK